MDYNFSFERRLPMPQINASFQKIQKIYSKMQFPRMQLTIFRLLTLLSFLIVLTTSFELTLTNRATFPTDDVTFFFDRQLIYQSSATFYLVEIYNSSRNLLEIDQSNHNNISNYGPLPIDNLNPSTFFLSFSMKDYLGFIYDLQSESGSMGTLLIVEKANFSSTFISSLFSSYVGAIFFSSRSAILAVSTYNSVNMIIDPETTTLTTISGPSLINNWAGFSDTRLTKSSGQNYLLVFSLNNMVFQVLTVSNTLVDSTSLTVIPQDLVNVSSVCFVMETSLAVHQNSTISFYSLPNFDLISSEDITLTDSSECYLDTISGQLIFVFEQNNETLFWSYNMSTAEEVNTTIVSTTSEVVFTDAKIYVISLQDSTAVSFSFFDYQSCHRNYYYDDAQFICYNCPSGCNSCNSSQFCHSDCLAGNYFIDDYCCGNSQYYQIVSAAKHCYNCAVGCYNCTSSQICLTCRANNYFIDDYCCGNSQYYLVANSSKHCYNCAVGCYNCTSSQICLTCRANNYFIDDYCCGTSQYYLIANSSKSCRACPSGCHNCSSSQNCYSCTAGNNLLNNYCCNTRKFLAVVGGLKSCQACPTDCYNCSNLTYCYTCTAGKTLMNNYCCLDGQYSTIVNGSGSCQTCPTGCNTCNGASSCLTCADTWMMGIDKLCYNSTENMPTGEQGNLPTMATKAMNENGFISFFNSFPSMRGFFKSVFGSSFGWFDELYLFQFHERDYGMNMQLLFKQMQTIQKQKWSGADWLITDPFLSLFSTSVSSISKSLDHKYKYSSPFWRNRLGNGQGFLVNTLSYFTTITILTIAVFLILKLVFSLLYRHRWSMFFRSFSYWPYLALLLMDGNLLQLVFFACSDIRLAFSFTFSDKMLNMFSWFSCFAMMSFSIAMFPLIYSAYHNRARYFSGNLHRPFKEIVVIYFAIEMGIKPFLQAFIHYFLKDGPYYQLQLISLIVIEVAACISHIFFILKGCFDYKFRVWLSVLHSLVKTTLIGFLLLRMQYIDVEQLNYKTDKILGYVTAIYIGLIYVNLGTSCLILIKEAAFNLKNRMDRDQKERLQELANVKQMKEEKAENEKLKAAAHEIFESSKSHKTTFINQERSFFFKKIQPKALNSDIVKVVRIKRGQEYQ